MYSLIGKVGTCRLFLLCLVDGQIELKSVKMNNNTYLNKNSQNMTKLLVLFFYISVPFFIEGVWMGSGYITNK